LLGGAQFNSALQSSFRRIRRIFTYALHVSAEAVNRIASAVVPKRINIKMAKIIRSISVSNLRGYLF
jgi:hypothetical protein